MLLKGLSALRGDFYFGTDSSRTEHTVDLSYARTGDDSKARRANRVQRG